MKQAIHDAIQQYRGFTGFREGPANLIYRSPGGRNTNPIQVLNTKDVKDALEFANAPNHEDWLVIIGKIELGKIKEVLEALEKESAT